LALSRGI
jgi:site-specific DNA recombinase